LRVAEINFNASKMNRFEVDIKIGQSLIAVSPITAQLFGGSLSGSFSASVHETPVVSLRQSMKGIQIDQMLSSTTFADRIFGNADIDLDIKAHGNSIGELRKSLNGKFSVALIHGSLAGINLRTALIDGKAELGSPDVERVFPANFSDKTGFSELKASFDLNEGKASCKDFEMKSPFMNTSGEGDIDLESGNLNYHLNATVSSSINRTARDLMDFRGVTVPIRVSGPYVSPNFVIDFAAASGGNVAALAATNTAKTAKAAIKSNAETSVLKRKKKSAKLSDTSKSGTTNAKSGKSIP